MNSFISLYRNLSFLKAVFIHAITAFGGPQGHFGMLHTTFVQQRHDITENDLTDLLAFCNILPGASSTQMITLIGYKRGGVFLAILTLLVWIIPASALMAISAYYYLNSTNSINGIDLINTLSLLSSMAVGFLVYAASKLFISAVNNQATLCIALVSALFTILFFKTPWIFPLLLLTAGIITNLSSKRIPPPAIKTKAPKVSWYSLMLFLSLFLFAGILSEMGTRQEWKHRKAINLFENTYRFGSMVFGGGDVLMAYMYEQYVVRPSNDKLKRTGREVLKMQQHQFLTGAGLVRAIPGPVFSIASYCGFSVLYNASPVSTQKEQDNHQRLSKHITTTTNATALKVEKGILGALLATIGIFLPSLLLALFFYPIWELLKKQVFIYRSLEGIHAAVAGIIASTSFYFLKDTLLTSQTAIASNTVLSYTLPIQLKYFGMGSMQFSVIHCFVVLSVFLLLKFTRIPPPIIVLLCILLGWASGQL